MAGFDATRTQPPAHREPAHPAPARHPAAPPPPAGANLPRWCVALGVAVLVLAAAGCNRQQNALGRDSTATGNEAAADYYQAADASLGHTEVEVRLFDRTLEMPASLPQGHVTFVVVNDGAEAHGFEIEGRGLEAALEQPLPPGGTGELQVDLAAGTYHVYCPLDDHRRQGMEHRLEVVR